MQTAALGDGGAVSCDVGVVWRVVTALVVGVKLTVVDVAHPYTRLRMIFAIVMSSYACPEQSHW